MKKIKENRAVSFIVIFFVYVIAAAAGFCVYNALGLVWWLKLLIADIAATVITFIFSVIFKNASVYDPYWSVQPIVILFACAVGKKLDLLRILLLIAMSFWGVRLTANWAYTFKGLDHQDWRYTMLKEKTGTFYPVINFIGIHLMPTLIVYGCILPACYAFQSDTEAPVLLYSVCYLDRSGYSSRDSRHPDAPLPQKPHREFHAHRLMEILPSSQLSR